MNISTLSIQYFVKQTDDVNKIQQVLLIKNAQRSKVEKCDQQKTNQFLKTKQRNISNISIIFPHLYNYGFLYEEDLELTQIKDPNQNLRPRVYQLPETQISISKVPLFKTGKRKIELTKKQKDRDYLKYRRLWSISIHEQEHNNSQSIRQWQQCIQKRNRNILRGQKSQGRKLVIMYVIDSWA
ncbi:unnamed protein product [Paramecium sonneborni]|uniref:Uncharacterized protein n=1 Tax=Paramecium sonneborni TaxID=65129 RepID=A0A8S1MNW5_9CILI|nr:unnamed protein product [Paramecium sonneborni]